MIRYYKTIYIILFTFLGLNGFSILSTPNLVSPTNGSLGNSPNAFLDWSTVTNTTYYEYKYSTNSNLNSVSSQTVSNSQVTIAGLLFGTTYYWQVRAIKTGSSPDSSSWSTIRNFKILDQITLSLPLNNAIDQTPDALLDWQSESGVTYYDYEWDTASTFNSPLLYSASVLGNTSQINAVNLRFGTVYYWRVRARHVTDTSDWSLVRQFTTYSKLLQIAPQTNAINQTPDVVIDWVIKSGVTHYDYEWDTVPTFNSPLYYYNSVLYPLSQVNCFELRFGTMYYWRVRARHTVDTSDWSPVNYFTTFDYLTPLSPANNSFNQSVNVILDWAGKSGITHYDYQWDTTATFNSTMLNSSTMISATSQITGTNFQTNNTYYWRLRARHAKDTSEWCQPWSFKTVPVAPTEAPELVSPINGSGSWQNAFVPLEWNPVANADNYQLQIDVNSNFNAPQTFTATTQTYTATTLQANTLYYWRVRGFNLAGNSPWSSTWLFRTDVTTGVLNINNEHHISLYPNPARDVVSIQFSEPTVGKIIIVNSIGEIVKSVFVKEEDNLLLLIDGVTSGFYMVYVTNSNNQLVHSTKLIVN